MSQRTLGRRRTGQPVVPESIAALPMFAELVVEGAVAETPSARATSEV
jgi:transposase